jgi:hypothetical protein
MNDSNTIRNLFGSGVWNWRSVIVKEDIIKYDLGIEDKTELISVENNVA